MISFGKFQGNGIYLLLTNIDDAIEILAGNTSTEYPSRRDSTRSDFLFRAEKRSSSSRGET